MADYRGRIVAVTGGTGALGAAVVGALAEAGAICHVPYRNAAGLDAYPHRHREGVTLHPDIDLTEESAVDRFYAGLPGLWASIHLAGGFAAGAVASAGKAVLATQLDMNVMTCYLGCRAAIAKMTENGGRIVNVTARPGLEWRGGAGMAAYAASKAAVAALTVALAEEVATHGILVNAVAPSIIDTPANRSAMPRANHAAWPRSEEVAQTILFLASADNQVTRGAIVPVYGRV